MESKLFKFGRFPNSCDLDSMMVEYLGLILKVNLSILAVARHQTRSTKRSFVQSSAWYSWFNLNMPNLTGLADLSGLNRH